VGKGYANPLSQIIVRILTREPKEEIDAAFFRRRIEVAWAYRKKIGYTENCRLLFGEADQVPALILDKFNHYFVLQTLALGMDRWKTQVVEAIQELFQPKGIYERNDVPVRELEGLPQNKGFLSSPFEPLIEIQENGLKFWVDLEKGQKTGYFLDQHENRQAIRHIIQGAEVLGAFCYTGSFEIHAAHYGARSVLGIDISEPALELARRNASLNEVQTRTSFECINAFDALAQWSKEGRRFDVVMLDPPAFAKNRESVDKALTAYKEINLRGIKMIRKGGFLVTSSCSNLVSSDQFSSVIWEAAEDAHRSLRQVCLGTQSPDHPILFGQENTHYLKFLIVQVN
jgi:23S rRNA (cytosine1962-C5)-methyltransferase